MYKYRRGEFIEKSCKSEIELKDHLTNIFLLRTEGYTLRTKIKRGNGAFAASSEVVGVPSSRSYYISCDDAVGSQ